MRRRQEFGGQTVLGGLLFAGMMWLILSADRLLGVAVEALR
ncbi:hypothetical protein ACQW02_25335 [Humitalea sp. 24SJ18S-53]